MFCLILCYFTVLLQEPASKAAVPTKKKAIPASKNGTATATGPVIAAKKVEDSSSDSSDDSDSDEELVSA